MFVLLFMAFIFFALPAIIGFIVAILMPLYVSIALIIGEFVSDLLKIKYKKDEFPLALGTILLFIFFIIYFIIKIKN